MAERFESEIARLRAENGSLSEELAQVQADKEFVWSLWKRLQVASPDLTQAVSLVVKREKEKSEIKDRKVLQILQVKDERIQDLQKMVTTQTADVKALSKRKADLETKISRLNEEVCDVNEKNNYLDQQIRSRSNKEKTIDGLHRQLIDGFEKDKFDLSRQLSDLKADVSAQKTENADLNAIKIVHENKIKNLQHDLKDTKTRYETYYDEAEELKRQLGKQEHDFKKHGAQIESKDSELAMVKKELSELWFAHKKCKGHAVEQATLIHQLQNLQQETQKMMKNQDETHLLEIKSIQSMYDELELRHNNLKNVEVNLRQDHLKMKEQLLSQDDQIRELHHNIKDAIEDTSKCVMLQTNLEPSNMSVQATEPIIDYEFKIKAMRAEIDILRERLKEKNRVIKQFKNKSVNSDDDELEIAPILLKLSPNRTSTPDKTRSRSQSPVKGGEIHVKYQVLQKRFKNIQEMLQLKIKELAELKTAHDKRLQRMKSVKNDFKLVKDQLRVLEEEYHGPKKKKKLARPEPKSLQKEDTDSVWNELTHFKNENKNLMVERMDLQEEQDSLKVQVTQDAATIHELKAAVQQEREEVDFLNKQQEQNLTPRQNFKEELRTIRLQLQTKEGALERLTTEKQELDEQKEKWEGERRILKAEQNMCKQEVAEKRIEIADLKKDISRLQREVCRRGFSKKGGRAKRKSSAKKFQRSLNRSIEEMNKLVDNFGEDGWEEISSESEDDYETSEWASSDTEGRHATARTQESLGAAIVKAAEGTGDQQEGSPNMKPSGRQVESVEDHIRRMHNKFEAPTRDDDIPKNKKRPKEVPKILLRPVSTQTSSTTTTVAAFGNWKRKVSGHGVHQINTLKQRLGALQQQLRVLRATKLTLTKSVHEYKELNDQLQADNTLANQRLRMLRGNNQKLVLDMDRLQHEKMSIEHRFSLKEDSESSSAPNTPRTDRSDQDWKTMEKRIKNSFAEVSRQSTLIKSLKTELDEKDLQLKTLQEKFSRLERDNSQKRILLEDNRLRLKIAQEHERTDIAAFDDLESRVKQLTETTEKQKTSLESCRKRLSVVSKEKRELEDQYIHTKADLDRKSRIAAEFNAKNLDLESMCTELEAAAQEQMRQLARKSEIAIDTAHSKLQEAHNTVQGFQVFVQTLADNLLSSTQHARNLARERARHQAAAEAVEEDAYHGGGVKAESMQKAQQLAKNILNISDADLQDIMNPYSQPEPREEESEALMKKDRKWVKKCQKTLIREDFPRPLVELFMEKVEETMMLLGPA